MLASGMDQNQDSLIGSPVCYHWANTSRKFFRHADPKHLCTWSDYGNSVLGATPSLHSPIVCARCGWFKYANARCGWWRYPNYQSLSPTAWDRWRYRGLVKSDSPFNRLNRHCLDTVVYIDRAWALSGDITSAELENNVTASLWGRMLRIWNII